MGFLASGCSLDQPTNSNPATVDPNSPPTEIETTSNPSSNPANPTTQQNLSLGFSSKTISVGNSIPLSPTGGTGQYSYSVSSNSAGILTGNTFTSTGHGTVTLTVSDGVSSVSAQVTVKGASEIYANGIGTCAKLNTGEVQCFGGDQRGLISPNPSSYTAYYTFTKGHLSPVVPSLALTDLKQLVWSGDATQQEHFCFLNNSGGVFCLGESDRGLMGTGTYSVKGTRNSPTTLQLTPVTPTGLDSGVTELVGGKNHLCALKTDGTLRCWGKNYNYLVSSQTVSGLGTPTIYSGLNNIFAVSSSSYQSCAINTSGHVYCWGDYLGLGYYGSEGSATSSIPVFVSGLPAMQKIAVGATSVCGVASSGQTYCWGNHRNYRLGSSFADPVSGPVIVNVGAIAVSKIVATNSLTCTLHSNGSVKCWGVVNKNVETPTNEVSTSIPVTTLVSSGADDLVAGRSHVCVKLVTGEVRCLGSNEFGQTGQGQKYDSVDALSFIRPLDWK